MFKYSIGLALDLNEKKIKKFFKKNKKNIHDIYFSLIDDIKFASRKNIFSNDKKKNKKLIRILRYLNKININLELVMNSFYYFKDDDFKKAYNFLEKNKIKIKTICILEKDLEICNKYFNAPKCYSYNNNLKYNQNIKNIDKFDEVVIGNNNIRNICLFKNIDIKIKILLNNGCTHSCNWCVTKKEEYNNKKCFLSWQKEVEKIGEEEVFSKISIFPFEQFIYKKIINKNKLIFKISCRSFNDFERFEKTFLYYKNNLNNINSKNFKMFGILKFYNTETFNIKNIFNYKKYFWAKEFENFEKNNNKINN